LCLSPLYDRWEDEAGQDAEGVKIAQEIKESFPADYPAMNNGAPHEHPVRLIFRTPRDVFCCLPNPDL